MPDPSPAPRESSGHSGSPDDDPVTVTLRRGQWRVIVGAARSYDVRVPVEQGDGGECLRVIEEAISDG